MQKVTRDLFLKLKAIRPIIVGVSSFYGIDWKDKLVEKYWLELPNKHIEFATEKELQDEIKRLIKSTESDLGLRYPQTVAKFGLDSPIKSDEK